MNNNLERKLGDISDNESVIVITNLDGTKCVVSMPEHIVDENDLRRVFDELVAKGQVPSNPIKDEDNGIDSPVDYQLLSGGTLDGVTYDTFLGDITVTKNEDGSYSYSTTSNEELNTLQTTIDIEDTIEPYEPEFTDEDIPEDYVDIPEEEPEEFTTDTQTTIEDDPIEYTTGIDDSFSKETTDLLEQAQAVIEQRNQEKMQEEMLKQQSTQTQGRHR